MFSTRVGLVITTSGTAETGKRRRTRQEEKRITEGEHRIKRWPAQPCTWWLTRDDSPWAPPPLSRFSAPVPSAYSASALAFYIDAQPCVPRPSTCSSSSGTFLACFCDHVGRHYPFNMVEHHMTYSSPIPWMPPPSWRSFFVS